jgi:hypothetical protein
MTQPSARPVDAHEIARRMGLVAPDEATLSRLDDALLDAEADVVSYLGRPIRPQQFVAEHLWPAPFDNWAPYLPEKPVIEVVSAVAEVGPDGLTETGLFTVTYTAGLDFENDPALAPIRRYVVAATRNDPSLLVYLAQRGLITPLVKSRTVSTEGQSVTTTNSDVETQYGGQSPSMAGRRSSAVPMATDSPGALPSRNTLDTWRIKGRRVHQAPPNRHLPGVRLRGPDGFYDSYGGGYGGYGGW